MEDILIAFSVGLLSAVSWQALPIMAGLAALIGGMSLADRAHRREANLMAVIMPPPVVLFLAGFGAMFMVLSLPATEVGARAWEIQGLLRQGCGAFTVMAGLHAAGLNPARLMARRSGRSYPRHPVPPMVFLLVGLGFAAGWSPKTGLVLSSILIYAASLGHVYQGMILLAAYLMGFMLLFFLAGLALTLLLDLIPFGPGTAEWGAVICGLAMAGLGGLLFFDRLMLLAPAVESGLNW
jgi:cytochrome c-type biogenesis protein